MSGNKKLIERRKTRIRRTLKKHNVDGRPRLSVFRSSKNIYAQVIDDNTGVTVAAASSMEANLRKSLKTGADVTAATTVGKLLAERAAKAGVKEVVFDRGPYIFHGRVKAVADAAREAGLSF